MSRSVGIATVTLNPAIDQSVAIPGFAAGRLNRVVAEHCDPGGKGVNVASFLADLHFRVAAAGLLGRDNAGVFEQLLAGKAITDAFVRVPGKTRVNVKIIDETAPGVTEINFPGPAATPGCLAELARMIDALLADHDCFVLSGSVPAGVPVAFYADLIRGLKAAGKRVLLDSSGDPLRYGIAAGPWAIKPNLAELEELVGTSLLDEAAVISAARQLLAAGVGCVVVSMGQAGALFVTGDECLQAIPPEVEVRSTVGAGDAMVAGFVAGSLRGWTLADSARLATASAVGALTQIGRRLPPTPVVESLMAQVSVLAVVDLAGRRPLAR
ncbi:1-phosphofructokinase [Accumulibacter sp.]|uniref:1-phosphofructokinase n=1 Tax=Accumulibacter sp. TaxID=2053492 RepID=UPI0026021E24|nr:1-phosphofructokinase [Accumulibacter sp.]